MSNEEPCSKVLVLGNDNRSFLSVVRSLGRKNICVHVGWCDRQQYAIKSKYIKKIHDIPLFSLTSNNWKSCLIGILKKEQFDLVIPCSDFVIIPLQIYKKEFTSFAKIYLLDDECYKVANDKYLMQKLVSKLDINSAKSFELNKSTVLADILSEVKFPIVLKPRSSFTKFNLGNKESVSKIYSIEDLQLRLDGLQNNDIILAQENFIGQGVGVEFLANYGEIIYAFQHVRVHEPLHGGGSSYRKSVNLNCELLEASRKIVGALNYHGVGMVEFKMNMQSGKWIFIELNARFWGSLPLAIASGADFPYYLFLLLTKGIKKIPAGYKRNIYCRNISSDLTWFIINLRADRSDHTLSTRPLLKVFCELFHLLLLRERNDTLVMDDIKPGIAELSDLTRTITRKIYLIIKMRIASLRLIRFIQKKKIMATMKNAKEILFVCKGNICRSPFAEYYLKKICPTDINILSAGYYPINNRECPKEAIAAARIFEINLSSHRSKLLNCEMINSADIIFIFDKENFEQVSMNFFHARNKIYFLGLLSNDSSVEITDPYKCDYEHFLRTYQLLENVLRSIRGK